MFSLNIFLSLGRANEAKQGGAFRYFGQSQETEQAIHKDLASTGTLSERVFPGL